VGALLAYSFPLLSLFWAMLIFAGIFLMIWFIIWCFVDNFRRKDHHGLAKAGWCIFIIFVPILGALVYIIARPAEADTNG
jgi:Phospholipase_D-nuclease N-terminal